MRTAAVRSILGASWALAIVAAVGACGWISGLDQLAVPLDGSNDDSAPDASSEASNDATSASDVGDGCAFASKVNGCFGPPCIANATCCIHATGPECAVTCVGIALHCLQPSDCATSGGGVCCLENVEAPSATCPRVIGAASADAGIASQCVTAGSCTTGGLKNVRMCTSDLDCIQGYFCRTAVFGVDQAALFGVCVQ